MAFALLWGVFVEDGTLPIAVIDYKMNGEVYQLLGEHFLTNALIVTSEEWIDNSRS